MDFDWDAHKNSLNRAKYGIGFEEATKVFDGPVIRGVDARHHYGEVRWFVVGVLATSPVVVIFTERGGRTRIISARRATHREAKAYFEANQN